MVVSATHGTLQDTKCRVCDAWDNQPDLLMQRAGFTSKCKARCSGDLRTWVVDGGKGLFEVVAVAQHNATATPRNECENWNTEWTFEIVIA